MAPPSQRSGPPPASARPPARERTVTPPESPAWDGVDDQPARPAPAPVAAPTSDELEWDPLGRHKKSSGVGRIALVVLGIALLGAIGWVVLGGSSTPARPVATVPPPAPVAPAPAPVVDAAVVALAVTDAAAVDAMTTDGGELTAEAALAADQVPSQPTDRLRELLTQAVAARSHGTAAALTAMEGYLAAGGADARAVAQFAYWLGRRDDLHRGEEWGERATTMDPQSQMAWYVLGATRLEDHHIARGRAFEALRRCAALSGPFSRECQGPIDAANAPR